MLKQFVNSWPSVILDNIFLVLASRVQKRILRNAIVSTFNTSTLYLKCTHYSEVGHCSVERKLRNHSWSQFWAQLVCAQTEVICVIQISNLQSTCVVSNKKLSCCGETVRCFGCFLSLNILPSHSRSFEVVGAYNSKT